MVYYDDCVAHDEANELLSVILDKLEEEEMQEITTITRDSVFADESIMHSFGISKLYFSSDDDTVMTEESLSHIFLPSFDTPDEYAFDSSFESMSDFELSPRNVTTKTFTNNSFLHLPDDILYDGLIEISLSRRSPCIKLLPRFSSQVHSIFACPSTEENNFEEYLDISTAHSYSDHEDTNVAAYYKYDSDMDSVQDQRFSRIKDDYLSEDNYWKSISDNYGTRHKPENKDDQVKSRLHSGNEGKHSVHVDAKGNHSSTVSYSYWGAFLESSCFSCNSS
jgi:hypothetical protein